jgi:hypothetical protein
VALGASNLTRGFRVVVETARRRWGESIEVLAALGHGRSYGARSRFLVRELPGILESALWRDLEGRDACATTALVTDVGNDVLYGVEVPAILTWVEEVFRRLERAQASIIVTDLPVFNARRLSSSAFALYRSLIVPSCRLSLAEATARAAAVSQGVVALAARHDVTLVRLKPEWYGLDPLHILPRHWRRAWQEILLAGSLTSEPPALGTSLAEWLRLYWGRPDRRWLFGREQRRAQPALRLPSGVTISLY